MRLNRMLFVPTNEPTKQDVKHDIGGLAIKPEISTVMFDDGRVHVDDALRD